MTEEQTRALIAAYQEERRGYVARGLDDRIAQVDEQLARLGVGTPSQRTAEKRPRRSGASQREERA